MFIVDKLTINSVSMIKPKSNKKNMFITKMFNVRIFVYMQLGKIEIER